MRGFWNSPAFTAAALLAIGLGIGVNTGVFTLLSGLVLRDLPLPDAGELITIHQRYGGIRRNPGLDPIGQHFTIEVAPNQDVNLEVIGVAKDAHLHDFTQIENSFMYLPAVPREQPDLQLLVRSSLNFSEVVDGIRNAAREIDPALVVQVHRLEENLEFWRTLSQVVTGLAGSLGSLALLLASIGVYGVVSYTISRRVREVGIRMALGAQRRGVLRMILVQSLRPVVIGMSVGLLVAIAVSKILESLLFGVSAHDALALIGAPLFLLGVATLACWVPVRRVIRMDPLATLRYE